MNTYLPVFVIIISVPSSWNLSHKSLVSSLHWTLASSLLQAGDVVVVTSLLSDSDVVSRLTTGTGISGSTGLIGKIVVWWEGDALVVSTNFSVKHFFRMCVKLNHLWHQISFNIVTIDSKFFFELLTFVFKKDVYLILQTRFRIYIIKNIRPVFFFFLKPEKKDFKQWGKYD